MTLTGAFLLSVLTLGPSGTLTRDDGLKFGISPATPEKLDGMNPPPFDTFCGAYLFPSETGFYTDKVKYPGGNGSVGFQSMDILITITDAVTGAAISGGQSGWNNSLGTSVDGADKYAVLMWAFVIDTNACNAYGMADQAAVTAYQTENMCTVDQNYRYFQIKIERQVDAYYIADCCQSINQYRSTGYYYLAIPVNP